MFEKAQQSSGLKWELTGALGKRTRFQDRDLAQLVVVAESSGPAEETAGVANGNGAPKSLPLNDELLLERIDFKADESGKMVSRKALKIVDQCILLAFW
jgi:hypothetical protein